MDFSNAMCNEFRGFQLKRFVYFFFFSFNFSYEINFSLIPYSVSETCWTFASYCDDSEVLFVYALLSHFNWKF